MRLPAGDVRSTVRENVGRRRLFKASLFVLEDEVWTEDIDVCIKFVPTMCLVNQEQGYLSSWWKNRRDHTHRCPGKCTGLRRRHPPRFHWARRQEDISHMSAGIESMHLQSERVNVIMGWGPQQDGLKLTSTTHTRSSTYAACAACPPDSSVLRSAVQQ